MFEYLVELAGLPKIGEALRGGSGGGGAVPLLNSCGDVPGEIIGLLPPLTQHTKNMFLVYTSNIDLILSNTVIN